MDTARTPLQAHVVYKVLGRQGVSRSQLRRRTLDDIDGYVVNNRRDLASELLIIEHNLRLWLCLNRQR
jgi:hypothetical protein